MEMQPGSIPLTWSQMTDIALGFAEAIDEDWPI